MHGHAVPAPIGDPAAPTQPRRGWAGIGQVLRRLWERGLVRWMVLMLPSILAAGYYGLIATDQYESEARFVVRSAVRPEMSGTLSFLVQLGLARSQDDSFIVQDFITSRDAVEKLKARVPLLQVYGHEDADFLARYPSLLYGSKEEQLYKYLKTMITVVHSERTGISTLTVRAFDATDARTIAETLLVLSEELVNRLNARLQTDAIANSQREVTTAQERLIDVQTRLTEFRNRELTVDPARNAVALAELIARLSADLGVVQAQVTEMKSGSAASPQIVGLQRKAAALQQQIAEERGRVADESDGLATRIAAYERLQLEREFARSMLSSAEAELVRARNDAARQRLYLERVVEPNFADYSTQPKRFQIVFGVCAGNMILILVGWLIFTGMSEHAPNLRNS